MSEDLSVTDWLAQLKQGDQDAATKLWERYFARVRALARRRLGDHPQRERDEEDLALSAMHALCQGAQQQRFEKLENRSDLWQLLAMLTNRKTIDSMRCSTRRPEVGESTLGRQDGGLDQLRGRSPSGGAGESDAGPGEVDALAATCGELLDVLEPKLRDVALLKLEGRSHAEIAGVLQRSERTVERYVRLIRTTWVEWAP